MRKVGILFLLVYGLTLHAQGTGALSKMDKLFSKAAQARTIRPNLPHPIKYGNFPPPTQYNKQFARMEKTLQRNIVIKQPGSLNLVNYTHKSSAHEQYKQVMSNFLAFKQQADPFLYYQTKDKRPLEPEETRQWLERIYNLKQQLASLRTIVSVREESVQSAYHYLNEVLRTVAPDVALLTVPQPYQKRQDRVYKEEEFFLHDPIQSPFIRTLYHLGLPIGGLKPIPSGLKIAVFNDNTFDIIKLKKWQEDGKLFPSSEARFFRNSYELLQMIRARTFVPDVIVSDVCAGSGTSGITLTQELRNIGYNGVIIALSGYSEDDIGGKLFMDYGFDGFIEYLEGTMTPAVRTRILRALQYHFYYRDLHGWMR